MTLRDYIDLVCSAIHRTDEPSRAEARKYIRARYEMIYKGCAWRDVCAAMIVPLPAEQVITLPYLVDRVIGIRWSNNFALRNEQLWTVMEIDANRFDQIGDPISYSVIAPVATSLSPGGAHVEMGTSASVPPFEVSIYGSFENQDREEVVPITSNAIAFSSFYSYDEIYSLSKSVDNADLAVSRGGLGEQILYLRAYEKERKHQRVHFHSTPVNAVTGLLMFKRTFRPLINDSDAPLIDGVDNALMAAARSDMQRGQRQYGKANSEMAESVAMIAVMQDLERHQSANVVRLIPDPEPDFSTRSTWTSKDHFVP